MSVIRLSCTDRCESKVFIVILTSQINLQRSEDVWARATLARPSDHQLSNFIPGPTKHTKKENYWSRNGMWQTGFTVDPLIVRCVIIICFQITLLESKLCSMLSGLTEGRARTMAGYRTVAVDITVKIAWGYKGHATLQFTSLGQPIIPHFNSLVIARNRLSLQGKWRPLFKKRQTLYYPECKMSRRDLWQLLLDN